VNVSKLANDLATLRARKPITFQQWLDTAGNEDRELVLAFIRDDTIELNGLVTTLRENGVPITRETITKYRRENQ
jgi:hypothetical protein